MWRITNMFYPQETNEPTIPDQGHREPAPPSAMQRLRGGCFRPALWTLLLLVVLGVGMVVGWGIGRTNAVGPASNPGLSQPATVPALTGTTLEQVREVVAAKVRPTVVEVIVALLNGKKALGSGVLIDPRGYIVTNNHVVRDARTVQVVLYNGTNMLASIAGTDPPDDLAVLKIHPPGGNLVVAT